MRALARFLFALYQPPESVEYAKWKWKKRKRLTEAALPVQELPADTPGRGAPEAGQRS